MEHFGGGPNGRIALARPTYESGKMASVGEHAVEDALNVLVRVAEKSGNLKNDLRKDILKAVSNHRKEFAKLQSALKDKKN